MFFCLFAISLVYIKEIDEITRDTVLVSFLQVVWFLEDFSQFHPQNKFHVDDDVLYQFPNLCVQLHLLPQLYSKNIAELIGKV